MGIHWRERGRSAAGARTSPEIRPPHPVDRVRSRYLYQRVYVVNCLIEWFRWFALMGALAVACSFDAERVVVDDAEPAEDSGPDVVDSVLPVDTAPTPDRRQLDAAVVPDTQRLDAAHDALADVRPDVRPDILPDARPDIRLDASPPQPLDTGAECIAALPHTCPRYHNCLEGQCRVDLRPSYYLTTEGSLIQPAGAVALQGVLDTAIETGSVNFLFEPGAYTPDGQYVWYVGAGHARPGFGPGGHDGYVFIHEMPIYNVVGNWFQHDGGGPVFVQNGVDRLDLAILEQVVVVQDQFGRMVGVPCMFSVPISARLELWPDDEAQVDRPRLFGRIIGAMYASDAFMVEIHQGGFTFRLADFLEGVPLDLDTNLDGDPDAYTFELLVTAEPIRFRDPDPRRDPDPELTIHEACRDAP